ncbi:MAG: flagellar export chaperone FliS [Gammaproteobacteria bacterium]
MNPQAALGQYQSVNQQGRIAASQNHGLVSLLLERILERLAQASGAMERGDSAASGTAMSDAIRIVDNLRASLNPAQGGDIAASLGSLYDYIEKRMVMANSKSDQAIIAEVASLITEIKTGWDGISEVAQK